MSIYETVGSFFGGEKEPSPEERMHDAKKRQLDDLIARRNAIMSNQALSHKAKTEYYGDTTELTTMNDNIKLLQKELEGSSEESKEAA
mgnify:CR=1 FL=1